MYDLIQVLGMAAWVIFYIFYGKHFGMSKARSLIISLFTLIATFCGVLLLTWIENGFKNFGAQNAVRIFPFGFIIFLIESKIFKFDFRRFTDYHAIWPLILYGVGHYACIVEGCCHGFQYAEGTTAYKVAYALTGTNMLPNQFFEATSALLICAVLYIVAVKCKYDTGGRLFFIMLIAYGTQRIGWEFLRDNDKLIVFGPMKDAISGDFGLSNLSFYAIAMVLEGIAFLVAFHIIDKKKKKTAEKELQAA